MTDEIKKCDCKEKFLKKLEKFALTAGAVFVGATLAILLSASILKPKCPPPMMMPYPGIHRQVPPPAMFGHHNKAFAKRHGKCPCQNIKRHPGKNLDKKISKQLPAQKPEKVK
ncbi:MAG: hypothetical protein K2F57_04230 [Candidatus Gastranaerophilales bacterium]|nr:hypothetical protein [Candidatus Gastranaerophilales bacterium]